MSTRVPELDEMVDDPQPPAYYNYQQQAAWRRGCLRAAWRPTRDTDAAVRSRYQKRHMQQAWLAGYDAMRKVIEAAKAAKVDK